MKPLNEIRAAKSKAEPDLLERDGVTGVDVGPKLVKGQKTDELSIRVFVEKKKAVTGKQKIPATISGVKTDVIERRFVLHPRAVLLKDLEVKADTGSYDPLLGGISIGPCKAVDGFVYVGTLGCLVRDRDTREMLMLTNYHVAAEKWEPGDTICQPSRVDGGRCPGDTVGSLVRSVISEHVDGAVCRISGRDHQCRITEIGEVRGKATASREMAVRKRGRTTGLTFGTVDSTDLSVRVTYDHGDVILRDQISIEVDPSESAEFGNSGDSGSVVVDDRERVIGLYYAGSDDGSFGVANPIDFVLDELNVDLCVPPAVDKSRQVDKLIEKPIEKSLFAEKPWRKESFKEFIKEYAYEKPPYSEYMDIPFPFPFSGSAPVGGAGHSVDERLAQLEAMAAAGIPHAAGAPPMAPRRGMRCADFGRATPGLGPNPVTVQGATFSVFAHDGTLTPNTRIMGMGGLLGLNAGFRTMVNLPPCPKVEVTLAQFAAPAVLTAYNESGHPVASATMTPEQGRDQTLTLGASEGAIVRVEIHCRQNETVIRRFCHCEQGMAGSPQKYEKPEGIDKKHEKFEKREGKEIPKIEKLEGKHEIKEKPEPKEFKDFKEKPEPKEGKELKEKDLYDQKRIPDGKPPMETKMFGDGPGANIPGYPGMPGPSMMLPGIEERLRRLEELLGFPHFIQQQHRPDLSQGALLNEPDLRQWS